MSALRVLRRAARSRRLSVPLTVAIVASLLTVYAASALGSGSRSGSRPQRSTGARAAASSLPLVRQIGQLIIATYQGESPPASLLEAIRAGKVGSVILMGDNTAGGVQSTKRATAKLQAAATQGGNSGLLIMTDQEGGEVKRLPGPPDAAAIDMANPNTAYAQGRATGRLLKTAGVNVDLAPVADVIRTNGFIEQEGRSFGTSPAVVASAACRFAAGLAATGEGYTLKHFPGLGDAVASTDVQPVSISESAAELSSDDAAYRRCGHNPRALVMISSASYAHLTGSVPAVMDPKIYSQVLPADRVTALPISDSLETGAIHAVARYAPARTALNAGLDMVMYSTVESDALNSYAILLADARGGSLSRSRVLAASQRVLALKTELGLGAAR